MIKRTLKVEDLGDSDQPSSYGYYRTLTTFDNHPRNAKKKNNKYIKFKDQSCKGKLNNFQLVRIGYCNKKKAGEEDRKITEKVQKEIISQEFSELPEKDQEIAEEMLKIFRNVSKDLYYDRFKKVCCYADLI